MSSKSSPLPTVTLPKNTKKRKKSQNEKKGQCSIRQEQHKLEKGGVQQDEGKTKKKKSQYNGEMEMGG